MRQFLMGFSILLVLPVVPLMGCGKYPELGVNEQHRESEGSLLTEAEKTGAGYVPIFLNEGYQVQDIEFEVKETIVDIGKGYKYRAITYDGHFPAKTITARKNTLVRIKLTNSGKRPHSLHTHIIKYKPASDGTHASSTLPGQSRYYFWEVTNNTPAGFYPFHGHGGEGESHLNRGLIGMIEVLEDASEPGFSILLHDLDPEFLFSTSGLSVVNAGSGDHSGAHGGGLAESGNQPAHLINGRIGEDSASKFRVKQGEKIRLGIVNLGENIHNFHPHGNFFSDPAGAPAQAAKANDVLELQPGAYRTVDLIAEAVGEWMYHCHVPGHPEGGMWSTYEVYSEN